jgi:uncharacterized protein (DUF2141 family)
MFDSNAIILTHRYSHSNPSAWNPVIVIAVAIVAFSATVLPAVSHAHDLGVLNVMASDFKDESGHAIAKLFRLGQNVRQRGDFEVKSDIRGGKASLIFPPLPAGEYAVVVFHDTNDNGVIDHNFIGLPNEALGFSNAFKLSLISGLPTFDKLKFAHGEVAQTIHIRMESL